MKQLSMKFKFCFFLIVWAVFFLVLSNVSPTFADVYSESVYAGLVYVVGRVTGIFPFSVIEVLLYIFLIVILFMTVNIAVRLIRRRPCRLRIQRVGANLFLLASILFFLYVINCGINYQRQSFTESAKIVLNDYTAAELKEVCIWLTKEINEESGEVRRDSNGLMLLDDQAGEKAVEAMQALGKSYTELEGYYPQPKGLLVPWILSIQNLSGIYSPFTIEANYNSAMIDYNIPFTMCHELSHLKGLMQEQEANFIAFLACRESDEASFHYSGNMLGWIYCMNVLYKNDYEAWEEVRAMLCEEANTDLAVNSAFWSQHDGPVAEVSNKVNDTYLKANGQADGVKSYNRMVDLIVAFYIQGEF